MPEWKRERASGGGVLLDLASHHVDLLRFLLADEVAEVGATVRSFETEQDDAGLDSASSAGPMLSSRRRITAVVATPWSCVASMARWRWTTMREQCG